MKLNKKTSKLNQLNVIFHSKNKHNWDSIIHMRSFPIFWLHKKKKKNIGSNLQGTAKILLHHQHGHRGIVGDVRGIVFEAPEDAADHLADVLQFLQVLLLAPILGLLWVLIVCRCLLVFVGISQLLQTLSKSEMERPSWAPGPHSAGAPGGLWCPPHSGPNYLPSCWKNSNAAWPGKLQVT